MRAEDGSGPSIAGAKNICASALAAHAERAGTLDAALSESLRTLHGAITERALAAAHVLQELAERERAELDAQTRRDGLRVSSRLHDTVASVAPGTAGAEWTSSVWGNPPVVTTAPGALRIGTHASTGAPALLPFTTVPGWRVTGTGARDLIAEVVVRATLAHPPEALQLTLFDPRLRAAMGFTSLLREVLPACFAPAHHVEETFIAEVDRMVGDLATAAEKMNLAGAGSFADLPPGDRGPFNLVVVLDAPEGLRGRAADSLAQLIAGCSGRGVAVLIETPGTAAGPIDLGSDRKLDLDSGLITVDVSESTIDISIPSFGMVTRDRPLDVVQRNNVLLAWVEAIAAQADRSMTLEALLGDSRATWTDRGADALVSTIGRVGASPLEVRMGAANPATPNVLIGGATGSGKSNLLLVMLYSLAHRYSPRDLRLYLLDFKEGIEFAQLAPDGVDDWLPHVAVLGLESDRSYGVAVLEHLVGEFDRRAAAFKAARVTSLASFREASGESMPRLLLVADEFQTLFEPDDAVAQRAVMLLEKLARKGRAYGVHLVLASQTLSGIQALGTKRESIFSQFHNRLSLRNTAAESESILGFGNLAAADLSGRGRVIVNEELGHPAANVEGTVVWAEPAHLDELRAELWNRYRDPEATLKRPETFASGEFSTWDRGYTGAIAAVGLPIEVSRSVAGFDLADTGLGCIGVIGADDEVADAVMRSLAVSVLLHPRGSRANVSILQTSGRESSGQTTREILAGVCGSTDPRRVSCVGSEEAGEFLRSLSALHADASSSIDHLVLVDDLSMIQRGGENSPYGGDGFYDDFRQTLAIAATRGVLIVVRFRSAHAFTTLGMFGFASDISRLVLTSGQADASRIDPNIETDDGWPRVTLVDTERGQSRILVPFDSASLTAGDAS